MTEQATKSTTLNRTLKTPSLIIFGLAYLTPIIVLGIFGVIAETSGGTAPTAYLVAMVAMLFTAHSYGRMALTFPVAGSAYTYVRRAIDPRLGFLVGWAVLLDYLFLPMVCWLIGGSYLSSQFPSIPSPVWILGYVILTTILNILGVRVADKANLVLMTFQVLVIVLFVVLAVSHILEHGSGAVAFGFSPFVNSGSSIPQVTAAAAVAAYSFLGFDAVTTLTEETIEPEKRMPRAIFLIALIGGGIFVLVAYVTQLVHPGGAFDNVDSASSEIAVQIGGAFFGAVFLAGLVVAQFASGIATQASASRLLYAMGRDGVLPKSVFGRLSRKFQTPWINILITGAVGLLALFLNVSSSTSFINFGGFVAFTCVNLAVIFWFMRQRRLGRYLNVISYVVAPTIGTLVCAFLLTQLDAPALVVGSIWLALGFVVLLIITRGLRRTPPEMSEE